MTDKRLVLPLRWSDDQDRDGNFMLTAGPVVCGVVFLDISGHWRALGGSLCQDHRSNDHISREAAMAVLEAAAMELSEEEEESPLRAAFGDIVDRDD